MIDPSKDSLGNLIFQPLNPLQDYVDRRNQAIARELDMHRREKNSTEHYKHTGGAWDGGGYINFPDEFDLLTRYAQCLNRLSLGKDMLDITDVAQKLGQSVDDVLEQGKNGKIPMFVLLETGQCKIPDYAITTDTDGTPMVNPLAAEICKMVFGASTVNKRWPDLYCRTIETKEVLIPGGMTLSGEAAKAAAQFTHLSGLQVSVSLADAMRYTGPHPAAHKGVIQQVQKLFGYDWILEAANKGLTEEQLAVVTADKFDPSRLMPVQPVYTNASIGFKSGRAPK
jgi:hypothetical protein